MAAAVNRDLFFEKFRALIASKREDNCFYFSQERYSKILSEVISAKTKCSAPLDYRRLKRFDILKINNEEKLIVPLKPGETKVQYYVTNDELFNILSETHMRIGHGGRTRMLKELQVKYKNITYEVVMLYLNLCEQCQMKHSAPKKSNVVKPMISSELNSRCQVELIDLQSHNDGEYKFIMVYQDHFTKFVQLRPLKTKIADEVAYHLLQIFVTFGAPTILHSDSGYQLNNNRIISELCAMWDDVKIVHGKPLHSQTQGLVDVNQDIQNMLTAWMKDNDTNKWSDGLPFVQFVKNTTYHEEIHQSPYEAVFGVKPKRGIASSFFPGGQIGNIETKEKLEEVVNTFDENLSGDHTEKDIPKGNIHEEPQPTTSSYQTLTERHEFISMKRAAAKENLLLRATKMLRTSKTKFSPVQIGDSVRTQVPDVDGGRTDGRNLLAVVGIEDTDYDKLPNKYDEISSQELLLREAAATNSRSGGQDCTRCNCKKKCSTIKCSCKSKGLLCNSKCHNSLTCCNK